MESKKIEKQKEELEYEKFFITTNDSLLRTSRTVAMIMFRWKSLVTFT